MKCRDKRLSRVARSSLLSGAVCVVAAMLVPGLALETTRPEWRDPEYGHRLLLLQSQKRDEPPRPLVLVLGTSRTQNAIRPGAMRWEGEPHPSVFNFGQSGASPLMVLLTLQRLVSEGVRPAAILVEVLPVWLTIQGPAEEQFRDRIAQLTRVDLERLAPYCDDVDAFHKHWLAARAAPWYAQRASFMSHWLPHWLPWQKRIAFQWQTMEADGFIPYAYVDPPAAFRARATEESFRHYQHAFSGFHASATSCRALRDLTALCRQEQLPLAIFEPPVASQFRGWFAEGVWESGAAELQILASELAIPLFPAREDFGDADFADGHHMLRAAAGRYSEWLASEWIAPWLSGK